MFGLYSRDGKYDVRNVHREHADWLIVRNRNKGCLLDIAKNLNSSVPTVKVQNYNFDKDTIIEFDNDNSIDVESIKLEDYTTNTDKSKLTDINSANVCADIKYGSVDKDNDNNNKSSNDKSNNDDSTKKSSSDCSHTGNSNITDNNKDVTNIKMQNDKQTDMNNSTTIDSFNTLTNIYGCNDENMYVSNSKPDGTRKKNFCLFCKKFQSKIARHLETIHCDEKEVKKFSALPKGTSERKIIIEILRRKGNFLFNTDPSLNNGELIVCRRPQSKLNRRATDFTCCIKCKGFFTKNSIRHHFAQCRGHSDQNYSNKNCSGKKRLREVQILGRKITGRIHSDANNVLKNVIFPVLREDLVTRSIRYDKLLIAYGNKLTIKYKELQQHDIIRARLRLLGRFWLAMKNCNKSLEQFSSIYNPLYYNDYIKAVQMVARLNMNTNEYKAPAIAANLRMLVKQVGNIFIMKCIKRHDNEQRRKAENFFRMLGEEHSTTINEVIEENPTIDKVVEENQPEIRQERNIILPSINDIQKLYNYLYHKQSTAYEQLKKEFIYKAWLDLAESTLILLQLFNRRKASEIERVCIEDFQSYKSINENTDKELYQSLSSISQEIVKKYVMFSMNDESMCTVSVILHSQLLECVQTILKYRPDAKVPSNNPYIFGIPNDNNERFKYLRAPTLLRKFSRECGTKLLNSLKGKKLRKHVATCCITSNLSEHLIDDLTNFMRHDNVHQSNCNQPISELKILRIIQLLEIAQGGKEQEDEEEENEDDNYNDEDTINDEKNGNHDNASSVESNKKEEETLTSNEDIKQRIMQFNNRTRRIRWNVNECTIIYKEFRSAFLNSKLPSTQDILRVKINNPALQRRSVAQIRTWIHNHISGKTKIRIS